MTKQSEQNTSDTHKKKNCYTYSRDLKIPKQGESEGYLVSMDKDLTAKESLRNIYIECKLHLHHASFPNK